MIFFTIFADTDTNHLWKESSNNIICYEILFANYFDDVRGLFHFSETEDGG